ncbi:MAG: YraN family protein [Lachnospiraceae bacterium]|nr:YraN family protein [Lachnospiraceae bacterium]
MNKRSIGTGCEKLAGAYLSSRGVRIVAQNFRVRQGEIDLIGYDGETLVFFEVKYRKSANRGLPQEAVDYRKQAQIVKVAAYYRNRYRIPEDAPQRFDVIAILGEKTEWIKNAFDGIL